ncbi:MAG: phosphoribosylglycinamide formyltransferase [Clostridium sp.]
MLKIAVLISGGGSNLQALIDTIKSGEINASIDMVISSKAGVYGLERAEKEGIKTFVTKSPSEVVEIIGDKVDLIVLAGYLSILDGEILKLYENKIINIHPSLIPSFCGKGMYGLNVHKAVVASGVKCTGCTVHFVNEEVDGGAIILQESVPVFFEDTPEEVQKRVLVWEHKLLPKAVKLISQGKVSVIDGKAKIN